MLSICTACGRHVRETACPFCGASVTPIAVARGPRRSRAAVFVVTATITAACGGVITGGDDAGSSDASSSKDAHASDSSAADSPFQLDANAPKDAAVMDVMDAQQDYSMPPPPYGGSPPPIDGDD